MKKKKYGLLKPMVFKKEIKKNQSGSMVNPLTLFNVKESKDGSKAS
nr:hypothetical protein [Enterobacter sp. ENT03]